MTDNHPCVPLGINSSFGFGDRIGSATPGHIRAMSEHGSGISPIYAQQSIREMTRTGRTPEQVMFDALNAAADARWAAPQGADADHLKTYEDVNVTHAAGFTFYTIDPSDHVDEKADGYSQEVLRDQFKAVREQAQWYGDYVSRHITLPSGTRIEFDEQAVMRCAVKYGPALVHAIDLANHIDTVNQQAGTNYEVELSVDETEQPTTPAEHYIVAEQCLKNGMKLVSLAPRFIGEMEKGIDYIGDTEALERSMRVHAEITEVLGPYKLSLHSGSDKLSMYTGLARATRGRFHVKTAGTSYLEALRVVARHAPDEFRRIIDFARDHYDEDKATYHVHAQVADVPAPSEVSDDHALEGLYLEHWDDVPNGRGFTQPGRQVLHCTFGSTLTSPEFGPLIRQLLQEHPETYAQVLADHFGRHLQALKHGM